jgi:probable DNA metabolism protein
MIIFKYDKTFEGFLTSLFDAYYLKIFPDKLSEEKEGLSLFCDELITIVTDSGKAARVWKGLEKKLSHSALAMISACWLADGCPEVDELLFRYLRKAIDAPISTELNFGDGDVLKLSKVYKQVRYERLRVMQFLRFQKAADGTYFAAFEPLHNVLPLATEHFRDRFADQKWLIYDMKRQYGYYYDLKEVREVTITEKGAPLLTGFLDDTTIAEDERLFQQLWKTYFKAISIKERANPRKHRQDMPVRYWKYLIEKQK